MAVSRRATTLCTLVALASMSTLIVSTSSFADASAFRIEGPKIDGTIDIAKIISDNELTPPRPSGLDFTETTLQVENFAVGPVSHHSPDTTVIKEDELVNSTPQKLTLGTSEVSRTYNKKHSVTVEKGVKIGGNASVSIPNIGSLGVSTEFSLSESETQESSESITFVATKQNVDVPPATKAVVKSVLVRTTASADIDLKAKMGGKIGLAGSQVADTPFSILLSSAAWDKTRQTCKDIRGMTYSANIPNLSLSNPIPLPPEGADRSEIEAWKRKGAVEVDGKVRVSAEGVKFSVEVEFYSLVDRKKIGTAPLKIVQK